MLSRLEARRVALQRRLDQARPAPERNRLGQFATPPALALSLARHAAALLASASPRRALRLPIRLIEPALGTGAFYSAALQALGPGAMERATGIELDPALAAAARTLWGRRGLEVIEADFTALPAPTGAAGYDLLLSNPPYVRHHHLLPAQKRRLRQVCAAGPDGVTLSGLCGLYCHFIVLGLRWLVPEGLGLWLVPAEFLDTNYGAALRDFLCQRARLLQVHRFDAADRQFGDALVSSAVVVARPGPPGPDHAVRLSRGGSPEAPAVEVRVAAADLLGRRWPASLVSLPTPIPTPLREPPLSSCFTIRRGLATGSNDFFILPLERARALGLPEAYLRPILPGVRRLPAAAEVIDGDAAGWPVLPVRLALLDCAADEDQLRAAHPALWSYLQEGRAAGLHQGYLASRRRPWFAQERRPAAPFLCTYMGRGTCGQAPLRFLWNRSAATAPNVYLMLYPTGALAQVLAQQPARGAAVLAALRGLQEELLAGGRVYGGGLHKIEPRELGGLPAGAVLRAAGLA